MITSVASKLFEVTIEKKARLSSKSKTLFPLIAILILASVLRLWALDRLPPGLNHDEAYNGLDALSLLDRASFPIFHEGWELYAQDAHGERPIRETTTPVFFEGNYGREPLFVYLSAASMAIFGQSFTSIRLVSVLFGLLAVVGTFAAGRALLWPGAWRSKHQAKNEGWTLIAGPLIAAFFMAIFFPTVHFSRVGFRAAIFVPFATMTVFFLWRGIRSVEHTEANLLPVHGEDITPRPFRAVKIGWFAASGLFLGLSLYTYAAARFLPLLIGAFFLIWWLQDRGVFNRYIINFLALTAVSLITASPLLLFLLRHPYYAFYRSRFIANRGLGTWPGRPWITWLLNLGRVARGLLWQGDQNILHNLPGRSFLDHLQAVLALLGLFSVIRRRPRLQDQFLIMWLLVMLLPGILSGDSPHFGRLLGIAPPLALLMSKGCIWLVERIQALGRKQGKALGKAAVAGVSVALLLSLSLTIYDYFYQYSQHSDLAAAFDNPDWELGQFGASLPEDSTVYLTPTQEEMATILFAFGGGRDKLKSFFSPQFTLVPGGVPEEAAYFLIRSSAESVKTQIVNYYPQSFTDIDGPDFNVHVIPADTKESTALELEDLSWGGAITLRNWEIEQSDNFLDVTLTWQAEVPMSRSYTAFVHLLNAEGELVAQLDRPPDGYQTSDWQEGEVVTDRYRLELPTNWRSGQHFIQSGFYHLASQDRLGEPLLLGEVDIKQRDGG